MTEEVRARNERIITEIYRELFKRADPSADFDKLVETGEAKKDRFSMNYYLAQEEQDRIIDYLLDRNKIRNNFERRSFHNEIALGCSPTGWKKVNPRTEV